MRVIGYHIQHGILANSDGQTTDKNYLDFLMADKGECIKVFYCLDQAVATLLKLWGLHNEPKMCRKLWDTEQLYIPGTGVMIKYRPHKYFSVKDGAGYDSPFVNFSDASQYLGRVDYDLVFALSTADNVILKAREAQAVCQQVYAALVELGLHPTSLTSPIRAWEKEMLPEYNLPTVADMPPEVGRYAYKCCHGGWVEVFKKGHFLDTWDYDIVSAYPYYLSQLLDHRYGKWTKAENYTKGNPFSFWRCHTRIDAKISPLIISKIANGSRMSYTPTGEIDEYYMTGPALEFIHRYNIGLVDVVDGWYWLPGYDKRTPLKPVIDGLFTVKEKSTGIKREVVKRITNGIWGKLGETHKHGFGEHFNPVWHAWVESQARIEVARFIYDNKLQDYLLSIAVDGVLSSHAVTDISSFNGGSMGSWRLTAHCPALVISSGLVAVKDKEVVSDFSANYDWLLAEIQLYPKQKEYTQTKAAPVTLGRAINTKHLDKLGDIIDITKTINVENEPKRLYKNSPKNGKQLLNNIYDSYPVDISIV